MPIAAQTLSAPPDAGGWTTQCETGSCAITRTGTDGEGNRLVSFSLVLRDGPGARLAVVTPLGTAVQNDLAVTLGPEVLAIPFQTCMPQGCVAMLDIDADRLANLTIQPSVLLGFSGVGGAQRVEAPFPLDGLSAAVSEARETIADGPAPD